MRLDLRKIRKAYPGIVANDGIDLTVEAGRIHAIVGENGAGKSTLMKIVYGMVRADSGDMLWEGREIVLRGPAEAQRLGIAMIFQHFALFDTLTVAQNIALASPGRPAAATLAARILEVSREYGLPVEPDRHVYTMSVGERQRVEIIRALLARPRLLIMDEPTAVLTPQAVQKLFATLRRLAAEGCSILYVSHKLDEVRELCDGATVLRGGRVVASCDPRGESATTLARLMIGAEPPAFRHAEPAAESVERLTVRGLSLPRADPFGTDLVEVALSVRAGEIVGIAGVSGNGQQELLAAICGEQRVAPREAVVIEGTVAGHLGPAARRTLGLAFVPEDRLGRAVVPSFTLAQNTLLTAARQGLVRWGMIRSSRTAAYAQGCIDRFAVRCDGVTARADSLSGGNLQKFIVSREIATQPKLLVVAQPTWGVDIGASAAIRQALLDLRAAGTAILVVSEDLDELLEITDRIAVIAAGRLGLAVATRGADRDEIGLAMAGAQATAASRVALTAPAATVDADLAAVV